jgi:small conductance mechanosensitive channel
MFDSLALLLTQTPPTDDSTRTAPTFDWMRDLLSWANAYKWQFVGAVLTLVIGLWAAKYVIRGVRALLVRGRVDATLANFLASLLYYALATLVVIAALSKLGVETTSFIAVVGAAGLAVGLALQGSLGNLAAGVMIMLFRPFRLGDLVLVGGQEGVVEEIQVFATVLRSLDNKRVIVPNSAVVAGSITNYTGNATRRVDLAFNTGAGENVARIRRIIGAAVASVPQVLQDPEVQIEYLQNVPGGLQFVCRPWCKSEDYWTVHFATMNAVKEAFEREEVSGPLTRSETVVIQSA